MLTKHSFIYSTKVWSTSWLATPLILFVMTVIFQCFDSNKPIYNVIMDKDNLTDLNIVQIFLIVYLVSLIASLPFWLFLWISTSFIDKIKTPQKLKKIYISLGSIVLLSILFSVFKGRSILPVIGLPWYTSVLFGIWYYQLQPDSKINNYVLNIDDHLIE